MSLVDFCGGEIFFDYNRDFNTSNIHFSSCFEHTVFDLVPCIFLWIFGILYYFIKRNSYNSPIDVSALFKAKLVFIAILWLLTWVDLGYAIWKWNNNEAVPYVDVVSPCVVGLGMATAAFFVHFDRLNGIRTSSILTCYWILYIILWALIFKSQVDLLQKSEHLSTEEILRCVTFFSSYACVIAEFIMCFIVDDEPTSPPNDPFAVEKEPEVKFQSTTKSRTSPESSATFLSKITFEWFTRMTITGYKRPIVDSDLWDLDRDNKAGRVSRHFLSIWNAEKRHCRKLNEANEVADSPESGHLDDERVLIEQPDRKSKHNPSLLKIMLKTFGPYFFLSTLLKVINDLMQFVSPQLLNLLIAFVSNDAPVWQGYLFAVLLFVSAIFQSVILQNYFHICYVTALRVRSAVVSLVYQKSLVLTNSARKESTIGEVVNLMSVDAQRFMDLIPYINNIWSSPFQIILSVYFLWQILGPSTLAGLAVMVLLIPINGYIANKAYKLQTAQMELKDDRIKLMNEILNGIKVLKMYAWEMSFKDKVSGIRNKELRVLRNFAFLNASVTFTWTCAPFLVSLTTFAVYVLSDPTHVLDAQKAFVSISLFNILQFPLIMLPIVISSIVQANVSLKRLQKFVDNDELNPDNVDRSSGSGPAISIEEGTFKWGDDEEPVLRDISMSVERGTLVAVVGQVGSGKSSLLSSLLGDMQKVGGSVSVKGSVAYVAQQAWIQNLTVRDNILFGQPMDVCKYQDTVEACELKEDFEMLPAGGLTEIGERGINLSGGQKQRVSIARAVYQDAEIYLFDDPLSAVDAHVGKHIFDNVLGPDGCLQSKTRVLVTHGVGFLPQVDQIYVVVDGKISEVGSYNELLEKNGDFAEFLKTYANKEEDTETETEEEVDDIYSTSPLMDEIIEEELKEPIEGGSEGSAQVAARRIFQRQTSRRSISDQKTYGPVCKYKPRKKVDKDRVCKLPDTKKTADNKLMTEETAETGNISSTIVISYMKSVGVFLCIVICVGYVLDNASTVYSSIWLSQWTEDPVINGTQNTTTYRLAIYGVLGLSKAFFVVVVAFSFSIGAVYASTHLHANMLNRIMQAPMSFFDTTPLGRIVNRFSKDIYLIDEVIPQSINSFLETFFQSLSTLFVIIYSTPIFGAVIVPILLLYYFVQRFYVRTSRQLKRLESVSRSPIYSHFSESLAGISTIRAYQLQKSFIRQNEKKVDTNQMAYYPNVVSNRWLALRLEVVGNLIVFFAAVFAVLESRNPDNPIQPGVVGLSVSYAMQITMILNWMVRSASEAETNIVAVERVEEYSKVKQEAPLVIEGHTPPDGWPEFGGIKFQNYSTKYRDELDLVVKDINVNIHGGEKIGIVGRTGAGKSSLTLALFRIIEAAGGKIVIDGLDVGSIGLHSLRSKLSIIPQDPVLFSGTLRLNLDPFEAYSDDELWNALEHSHLKNFASSLPKKLDHEVSEGGENLSVGQRQLVCLARALLRKSKILVLDEATAAVDLETDDLIQATIRDKFSDCTTFTIAHRLNTIMDSTRVLVLDAGKVAEYDSPGNLLKNKGIFYGMAKDAGLAS